MESRGNFEEPEVKQKTTYYFCSKWKFVLSIQLFVFNLRKKRSAHYFAFGWHRADNNSGSVSCLYQWFICRFKDKFTEVRYFRYVRGESYPCKGCSACQTSYSQRNERGMSSLRKLHAWWTTDHLGEGQSIYLRLCIQPSRKPAICVPGIRFSAHQTHFQRYSSTLNSHDIYILTWANGLGPILPKWVSCIYFIWAYNFQILCCRIQCHSFGIWTNRKW